MQRGGLTSEAKLAAYLTTKLQKETGNEELVVEPIPQHLREVGGPSFRIRPHDPEDYPTLKQHFRSINQFIARLQDVFPNAGDSIRAVSVSSVDPKGRYDKTGIASVHIDVPNAVIAESIAAKRDKPVYDEAVNELRLRQGRTD